MILIPKPKKHLTKAITNSVIIFTLDKRLRSGGIAAKSYYKRVQV